jgi:hypothetical protein
MNQPKESPGADMIRMAKIDAELTRIRRSRRKGVSREAREAAAAPLVRELTSLRLKWWGKHEPPATMPE